MVQEITLDLNKGISLNMEKGQMLNLTKSTTATKYKLSAGWDVAESKFLGLFKQDADLDLVAYIKSGNGLKTVYYGNKHEKGIYLDGDNRTGEGDGDDENIFIDLNNIESNATSIVFGIVIYTSQKFKDVKNAYVRLSDTTTGEKELVRYNLSNDRSNKNAMIVAELKKNSNNEWEFITHGEYYDGNIRQIGDIVRTL